MLLPANKSKVLYHFKPLSFVLRLLGQDKHVLILRIRLLGSAEQLNKRC